MGFLRDSWHPYSRPSQTHSEFLLHTCFVLFSGCVGAAELCLAISSGGISAPCPLTSTRVSLFRRFFFASFSLRHLHTSKIMRFFMDSKLLRRHWRINLQFVQYYWGCSRKISNFLIFLTISLCFVSPMFYFSPLI